VTAPNINDHGYVLAAGTDLDDLERKILTAMEADGVNSGALSVGGMPRSVNSCRHDVSAWFNARRGAGALEGRATVAARECVPAEQERPHGAGGFVDLKLEHHTTDGIEVVDVEGEIDVYTAPRLRELLIDLVNNGHYQLVVNMEKVEFLDSTGLGVLVGGLKRVRAHDGSLDLVCTQERILKIFRITGLTKVFGIHDSVDEAIAARKSEK
jgi:anti-sigma B factor antagonist